MDFESPDVEKDFPGLYASEAAKKSQSRDSDYSDEDKVSRKDLLKRREKKESKKDKGYVAFEGESSGDDVDETRSPGKTKKNKSTFKFPGKDKKERHGRLKEKDVKEKKEEEKDNKTCKKEKDVKDCKKESKDCKKTKNKSKEKKKKESKLLKIRDKKKKTSDQEMTEDKPIFGVPLQEAVERSLSHDGLELPVVVRECIDYIEEHGLACEGIYRISDVKSKVRQLKSQYNRGEKVYLYEHEPHIVASLLKQFLRDLPEPILTSDLMPKFEEAAAMKNEQKRIETLAKLMESLPNCNRLLLAWIFVHMLHVVNLEKRNKMNLQNVSIVLSPTMQISHRVLHAFFAHSDILFKGTEIKKYIPPIEPDSSRLSLELPDSPKAIEEELYKQENLLNVIHAELNTGLRDKYKEEQLWEVQRVVTQLKRKLRFLRQVQDASKLPVDDSQADKMIQPEENTRNNMDATHQQTPEPRAPSADNAIINENISEIETDVKDLDKNDVLVVEKINEFKEVEIPDSDNIMLQAKTPEVESEETKEENENHESKVPVCEEETLQNSLTDGTVEQSLEKSEKETEEEDDTELSQEELLTLYREEIMLRIQQEELLLLGDELRRKVNSEKKEIGRLQQEIIEYQQLYKYNQYSFDSTENSSSDSDDSSISDGGDNDDLVCIFEDLVKENKILEQKNLELTKEIQKEREACVDIKVQMKMLQMETLCIQV